MSERLETLSVKVTKSMKLALAEKARVMHLRTPDLVRHALASVLADQATTVGNQQGVQQHVDA